MRTGEYGPHGREIIEMLPPTDTYLYQGLKRTGDRNVPSGKVSFRIPRQTPVVVVVNNRATLRYVPWLARAATLLGH